MLILMGLEVETRKGSHPRHIAVFTSPPTSGVYRIHIGRKTANRFRRALLAEGEIRVQVVADSQPEDQSDELPKRG